MRVRYLRQTITNAKLFGRGAGSEASREIGLNEPRRAPIKQDVMGVSIEARHMAARVGPHVVTHERFGEDVRLPRAREFVIIAVRVWLTARSHAHDVAELQPRQQVWIVCLGRRRIENAELHGVLENRALQGGQESGQLQRAEPITAADQVQRGIAVLQHPVVDVLLGLAQRDPLHVRVRTRCHVDFSSSRTQPSIDKLAANRDGSSDSRSTPSCFIRSTNRTESKPRSLRSVASPSMSSASSMYNTSQTAARIFSRNASTTNHRAGNVGTHRRGQ